MSAQECPLKPEEQRYRLCRKATLLRDNGQTVMQRSPDPTHNTLRYHTFNLSP